MNGYKCGAILLQLLSGVFIFTAIHGCWSDALHQVLPTSYVLKKIAMYLEFFTICWQIATGDPRKRLNYIPYCLTADICPTIESVRINDAKALCTSTVSISPINCRGNGYVTKSFAFGLNKAIFDEQSCSSSP